MNLSEQLQDVLDKLKKHDEQMLRQQVQLNKQSFPRENGVADGKQQTKLYNCILDNAIKIAKNIFSN